ISGDETAEEALTQALRAARILPAEAWHQRLVENAPDGAAEAFLALVRQQVYARAYHSGGPYGLETEVNPPAPGLLEAAGELDRSLATLQKPLNQLVQRLAKRLNDDAEDLETPVRLRIEVMMRGLRRRADVEVTGWRLMLQTLGKETPPDYVDWFAVDRIEGR